MTRSPSWEEVVHALQELNEGRTGPALALCSEDVSLKVPNTWNPLGKRYFGKTSLDDLWQRTRADHNGVLLVEPVHLLSDEHHLVLVLDALSRVGTQQQTARLIVTGAIADGRCTELWLHFDEPVPPHRAKSGPAGPTGAQ